MGWLSLLMAGALEIVWILALKYSDGFTRLWPSIVMLVAIGLSFALLGLSLKSVPFGTIGCLILIVGGTIGLRLVTPG